MAKTYGKVANAMRVPVPRANPLGRRRQVAGFVRTPQLPRPKPLKTRMYPKTAQNADPMQYTGIGFGNTGLTGES